MSIDEKFKFTKNKSVIRLNSRKIYITYPKKIYYCNNEKLIILVYCILTNKKIE